MMKKQLIMEKALELFANQGFEATSIQQITEHCGISKGSFYLAFKSKDELILALIDHFMMQITSNIDYTVRTTTNDEKLLYEFYYTMFHTFYEHSDFAKILIKELIVKIHHSNKLNEKIILSMIERLYGDDVEPIKYDLIYSIKGFTSTYLELFLFYNVPIILPSLANVYKKN